MSDATGVDVPAQEEEEGEEEDAVGARPGAEEMRGAEQEASCSRLGAP